MRLPAYLVLPLLTLATSELGAQAAPSCSLLTAAEITSATGTAPAASKETSVVIPSGPSKGETMHGCMWPIGEQGMVNLSLVPAAKGASKEAGTANMRQAFERLKAQGWTEERKEFGSVVCTMMTPPAGKETMPLSTGCMGETKGMAMGIGMAGKKRIPMAAVKTLWDQAAKRL